MSPLLAAVLGVVGALSLLAWLAPLHAIFELAANLRSYLLILALVCVLGALFARRGRLATAAAIVAFVQLFYLWPYLTPSADAVTAAPTARVLQYNIWFGNDDYDRIVDTINTSGADVVAIHELTDEQWTALAPQLDRYPFRVAVPVSEELGRLGGGMALLSRSPLVEIPVTAAANKPDRPILAIETTVAGRQVTVIGLHPHASRFDADKVNNRQAQLDAVVDLATGTPGPALVMTDMNVTPFSPDYKDFLSDLGWRDPHKLAGWHATWPDFAGPIGTPIDHIFVSDGVLLHSYETGHGAGSDHATLTATVSVP